MSNLNDTMAAATDNSAVVVKDLDEIQDIIDISADRLEGLRTQCATSATLTQQEIRSLESKLVRMFSDLLLKKARLNERIPANGLPHTTGTELKQWLRVVGLSAESLNACLMRIATLEQLLEQSDDELKQILSHNPNYREEEVRRLTKAMHNLRKYKDFLSNNGGGGAESSAGADIMTAATTTTTTLTTNTTNTTNTTTSPQDCDSLIEQLYWDSFDRHHHRGSVGNIGGVLTASPRPHRMAHKQGKHSHQHATGSNRQSPAHDLSSKSMASGVTGDDMSSMQGSTLTLTLTPSPPNSPFTPPSALMFNNVAVTGGGSGSGSGSGAGGSMGGGSLNGTPQRAAGGKFTGTPPPLKKHQTLLNSVQTMTPTHSASNAAHQHDGSSAGGNTMPVGVFPKTKYGDGHHTQDATRNYQSRNHYNVDVSSDNYNSSATTELYIENNNNANNSLHVPNSPAMPVVKVGMTHNVSHRFNKTYKMRSTCDLCQKPMYYAVLQCRECKYRCHRDCEAHVPPSCGLPKEYVNTFKNVISASLQEQMSFPNMSSVSHQLQTQSQVNTSPNLNQKVHHSFPRHQKHDSSSPGSSCNSSSPSSPALFNIPHHGSQQSGSSNTYAPGGAGNIMSSSGGASSSNSSNHLSTPSSHKHASQFNFPEVTITASSNHANAAGGTQTLYSSQPSNTSDLGEQQHDAHDMAAAAAAASHSSHKASGSATSTATSNTNHKDAASMSSSITISSSNCNSVSLTSSIGLGGSVSSSIISATSTGTFYQRKLSSAGVDKRPAFISDLSDTHKSNDSDKTVSLSGSTSASTDSDRTPIRLDSTEDGDSGNWPRQNSLSLKEWDIPYGDLRLLEQIGRGRFGTVHRAHWHGDVAVKLLKEDYLDDEQMLDAFKAEVANFKKTRHENLVLFMGACMSPPFLAIVTSLCKGNTLYTYIHQRREKFTINKTTLVAQQISQGMGYLHARGICHKDLRTKNIFLENGKVIITDFGLFSSTKLLYCDIGLGVPKGWLCYLAPELMRALMPCKPTGEILPFSCASDVYSFGTVWYELLCGEFPFKMQPHESIIWQVGRGMKQTLANLQTSRDVKDILMLCWKYNSEDRPDFPKLLTLLERLPKKRLARSPSHPVQLSRSAESVF